MKVCPGGGGRDKTYIHGTGEATIYTDPLLNRIIQIPCTVVLDTVTCLKMKPLF
jgi:hypothetical protein